MTLHQFIIATMSKRPCFFNKSFYQSIVTIEKMASPKGTTIAELTKCFSITRRSVFRLLRTIERDLKIPISVKRDKFGGTASYHLPQAFIEKLSDIKLPSLSLNIHQAIKTYLIISDHSFSNDELSATLLRLFYPKA